VNYTFKSADSFPKITVSLQVSIIEPSPPMGSMINLAHDDLGKRSPGC